MNFDLLKEYLFKYKELTLDMVESLNKNNIDSLSEMIDKREDIIKYISQIHYTHDEFVSLCNEFQLMDLEKRLNELIKRKKERTSYIINKLSAGRNVNIIYNKNVYENSGMFSKKV